MVYLESSGTILIGQYYVVSKMDDEVGVVVFSITSLHKPRRYKNYFLDIGCL